MRWDSPAVARGCFHSGFLRRVSRQGAGQGMIKSVEDGWFKKTGFSLFKQIFGGIITVDRYGMVSASVAILPSPKCQHSVQVFKKNFMRNRDRFECKFKIIVVLISKRTRLYNLFEGVKC